MNSWPQHWERGVLATGLPGRTWALHILYEVHFRVRKEWCSWLRNSCYSPVQSLSCVRLFATPRTAARQASLSITNSWSLLKLMSIESVMPSNHLIRCHPLFLLPSIFPSIRVYSDESVLLIRWPKDWLITSASVLPTNIQDWFPFGSTGWISLQSKGLSRVFSTTTGVPLLLKGKLCKNVQLSIALLIDLVLTGSVWGSISRWFLGDFLSPCC